MGWIYFLTESAAAIDTLTKPPGAPVVMETFILQLFVHDLFTNLHKIYRIKWVKQLLTHSLANKWLHANIAMTIGWATATTLEEAAYCFVRDSQ